MFTWISTGGGAAVCSLNRLFDKTVTVYRLTEDGIQRQELENCFFVWEDTLREDEVGKHTERKFRLITPGPEQSVFTGCRVLPGSGPEITLEQWNGFIPAKVAGLCEVAYASPRYFCGQLSHTEAGRK